jgi:hypothetical protein
VAKPNCLYQTQPIDVWRTNQTHIRKVSVTKVGIDCPRKTYEFCFLAKILSKEGAQSSDVFLNFFSVCQLVC